MTAFLFIAVSVWGMEFYFERLYGDLTRIGYFSEHDFGWQASQPAILPELFKDYPIAEADILVIGDSFSDLRVWQSQLVADGLKVSTMHWQYLKTYDNSHVWGALRSDLGEALRTAGFKGRYVIIESVERVFQDRVKEISEVHQAIVRPDYPVITSLHYPFPRRKHISFNKLNGANWSIKTLYNTIKLSWDAPKQLQSGLVRAVNFDGCQLFSHRLCQYAIFHEGDFNKEAFNAITNVLSTNKNLQNVGIQPIWLIIPDKATTYLSHSLTQPSDQNIWQLLGQYSELIAPDIATAFIAQSRHTKDFYMPNDTHLSTTGFLYLGELMSQELHKLTINPTQSFKN